MKTNTETITETGKAAINHLATDALSTIIPEQPGKTAGEIRELADAVQNAGQLKQHADLPFEELDTPTATRLALSGLGNNVSAGQAAAAMLPVKIAARVYIGETPIKEILSLQMTQQHGNHNILKLRFFQDQAQAQGSFTFDGAEKLLGQVTEIELHNQNDAGSGKLQHIFVIADVQFDQDALNEGIITVTGYAPTWILDGAPHFETFYKKNLDTIAQSVCKSLPQVKSKLKAEATLQDQIPYVSRYNESVWNFMKRISSETGQWLYFNGTELVFGKPENKQGPKLVYGQNCYHINMSLQAKAIQQSLFDYEAGEHKPLSSEANTYNGQAGAYNQIAFNKSKELFGGTPAVATTSFLPAKDSTLKAIAGSKAAQSAAGMYRVKGDTTLHELNIGMSVEVDFKRQGQSASHAPLRIISIEHNIDATGNYINHFEAIPSASEMPPAISYQKPVTYPMLAEVIDNKDNQGRVRVKFLGWQQQGIPETDYIRVLTPDAGGGGEKVARNRGLVTVPEMGDQVYVDFEQGNPERPFVTGSVFHGKTGTGGGDTNKTKSLTTRSGCAVILDDSSGSATLKDPSGNIVVLNGDGTMTITAPNSITINTKDFILNASNSIALNAQPGQEGGGEGVVNISAKKTISATADTEGITLDATVMGVAITGKTEVSMESTSASVSLTGATDTMVNGSDIYVTGGGTIRINSSDTDIT